METRGTLLSRRRFTSMAALAFKALSIVAGGMLLGAFGSALVKPVPKDPEPQSWQLSGRSEFTAPAVAYLGDAGPEGIEPYSPDKFAPSWADDETIWQYPEPRIDEWEPEPYPSLAELDAQLDEQAAAYEQAEQAGAEAEAASSEAQLAGAPDEAQPLPGDTRKSDLVAAGLY